jgi:hypothetical protein
MDINGWIQIQLGLELNVIVQLLQIKYCCLFL